MKLTLEWLKEKGACSEGVKWFMGQKESEDKSVLESLISSDHLNWANWFIVRLMGKLNQVRYAVYAAEQVISMFEKKYPNDKRPRKAIEAAKAWIKNPTEKNRVVAASAADAAADADAYAAAAYAAAARKKLQLKILSYGMKLLKGGRP